jgi:recombination protein RecR
MAFHLLQGGRGGARTLAEALMSGLDSIKRCNRCRMLTDGDLCSICSSTSRDTSLLCVVESPADVVAVEQSGSFRGRYFVLHGHLSPLDGIGPEQIGAREFEALLDSGEAREILRHYEEEPDFRDQVNRYIADFETMLRRVLADRDGSALGITILSSDMGKLYVALAQAIERLRR